MADSPQARIRRLQADEWQKLRSIRLEMLADTPTAYVESLESARAQSEEQWQDRAAAMAGPDSVSLVADDGRDGSPLRALMRVVAKLPTDMARPRQAMLISVYVAPEHRGSGLADAMLRQAVDAAAEELGARLLQLGVHQDNGRAQRFYLRHGFADTGAREPYPLDTGQSEIIMERVLPAGR
ncbi:N-acetyltransferase family protein [Arthrobacter sp. 2MCAF15]|uniref:GNAT family N-acetyltransferase n=1 Tax=Arthrobacter sp. 2MCAF15 TaxID=3232984 RepID=UPI003F8E4E8B